MVIRSVVAVHNSRSTRLVVVAAVFLGLIVGSWRIDGQLEAAVPSSSQEENRGSGYAHLKLMQDSVTTLASSLGDIYPDDCDSVTCDVCSQDECLPLTGNKSCSKVKIQRSMRTTVPSEFVNNCYGRTKFYGLSQGTWCIRARRSTDEDYMRDS